LSIIHFFFKAKNLLFSHFLLSSLYFIFYTKIMSFLSNLTWRYATKKFDTARKVSHTDLTQIIEAIRLTPTSFGLQPYHFYVVSNPDILAKIGAAAYNQPQLTTASHVIVFAARTDFAENNDEYFAQMSGGDTTVRGQMKGFEDMLVGFATAKSADKYLNWATKQAYIAHGFGLAACAELQIDSCGMEGFDPTAVGEIVGLPATQKAVVMLPIGYRAE
jgi:nitroreductase